MYLRGGLQHHWIVLEESAEPGLGRVALEVDSRAELDAFEARLKALGVAFEAGDGLDTERVNRYLRFADPADNPLELYCDMVSMPTPPTPRTVQLLDIQHVVLGTADRPGCDVDRDCPTRRKRRSIVIGRGAAGLLIERGERVQRNGRPSGRPYGNLWSISYLRK